jgi:hypothetical protein
MDMQYAAEKFAQELRELAKASGFDHRGIKVIPKRKLIKNKHTKADARVVWPDGPPGWQYKISSHIIGDAYLEPESNNAVSFYGIGQ